MSPPSDSADELRRLRERVYGAGAEATVADMDRLRDLETPPSVNLAPHTPQGPHAPPPEAIDHTPAPPEGPHTPAAVDAADTPRRSRWRTVLGTIGIALLVGVAAFVAGMSVAAPPAPDELPEFLLPQTQEDIVASSPDDPIAETVDLSSTRFIARIDDVDVFIARPPDSPGVCIFTRVASSEVFSGTGCSAGGPGRGGVGYGMVGGLQIFVGEPSGPVVGDPIRLSESVTAYVS
ncbi:hypothetical protein ACFXP7_02175 [Microbacterium sp. P06]|uniref:hypothetical protein n=1 Tax=Microbacterium sp. P06 TaxID=3366949 RepID=UPI003745ACFB